MHCTAGQYTFARRCITLRGNVRRAEVLQATDLKTRSFYALVVIYTDIENAICFVHLLRVIIDRCMHNYVD